VITYSFYFFVKFFSSQVNPCSLTEKTAKITTQISVNSQPEASGKESIQKSKITSIEGNKLSSFKSCKITPAFSSFKTSRSVPSLLLFLNSCGDFE